MSVSSMKLARIPSNSHQSGGNRQFRKYKLAAELLPWDEPRPEFARIPLSRGGIHAGILANSTTKNAEHLAS